MKSTEQKSSKSPNVTARYRSSLLIAKVRLLQFFAMTTFTFSWYGFRRLVPITFLLSFVMNSCKKDNLQNSIITLALPYSNPSEIDSIGMTYVLDTSKAPWKIQHSGIDFHPDDNVRRIQAVAQGTVENVMITQDINLNWLVEARIKYNSRFAVLYSFNMDSPFQNDANTQRDNVFLEINDVVGQGDIIGNLFVIGQDAHLQLTLIVDGISVCPESYFLESSLSTINALLTSKSPGIELCYQ